METNIIKVEDDRINAEDLINTSKVISDYCKNNLNLSEELKRVLENLSGQKKSIEKYQDSNALKKFFFKPKEVKWENQAENVYKGLEVNFLLNRQNTLILMEVLKFIFNQEYKIKENLKNIAEVSKRENENFEEVLTKLDNLEDKIDLEKENTMNEIENFLKLIDNGDEFSKEVSELMLKHLFPSIKQNQKKIMSIDDYVLRIEKDHLKVSSKLKDVQEKQKNDYVIIEGKIEQLNNNNNNLLKKIDIIKGENIDSIKYIESKFMQLDQEIDNLKKISNIKYQKFEKQIDILNVKSDSNFESIKSLKTENEKKFIEIFNKLTVRDKNINNFFDKIHNTLKFLERKTSDTLVIIDDMTEKNDIYFQKLEIDINNLKLENKELFEKNSSLEEKYKKLSLFKVCSFVGILLGILSLVINLK